MRAVMVALTIASATVLAPSASALPPGCDWNTDVGAQACLSGGPMDAGKNGHGDTYGPSGAAGFLHDIRLILPSMNQFTDKQLLDTAAEVCRIRRTGLTADQVKTGIANIFSQKGVLKVDSDYLEADAEMYLCPGLPGR